MEKTKWTELERYIRFALRAYAGGEMLGTQACRVIDEALAAVTRRGNELQQDALPWESDSELSGTKALRDSFWR